MDIKAAIELLETPGTILKCHTEQMVESYENETEVWIRITAEFEDGTKQRIEMRMPQFANLYSQQVFAVPKNANTD